MKRKAKFRVGQVVYCKTMRQYVRVLRILKSGTCGIPTCYLRQRRDSGVRVCEEAQSALRLLTLRERGAVAGK